MEPEPMFTPRGKSPQPEGPEQGRTHNAASCRTESPIHYRLSYSDPLDDTYNSFLSSLDGLHNDGGKHKEMLLNRSVQKRHSYTLMGCLLHWNRMTSYTNRKQQPQNHWFGYQERISLSVQAYKLSWKSTFYAPSQKRNRYATLICNCDKYMHQWSRWNRLPWQVTGIQHWYLR